jgi:NADH-quinone oxidoreductase subunit G
MLKKFITKKKFLFKKFYTGGVNVFINGKHTVVKQDSTIYEASNTILSTKDKIPVLCHHPILKPVGVCRVCLVQLGEPIKENFESIKYEDVKKPQEGDKLIPSCSTPVTEGMNIWTNTDVVETNIKDILKFTLTNHPLVCPTCPVNNSCVNLKNNILGTSRYVGEV